MTEIWQTGILPCVPLPCCHNIDLEIITDCLAIPLSCVPVQDDLPSNAPGANLTHAHTPPSPAYRLPSPHCQLYMRIMSALIFTGTHTVCLGSLVGVCLSEFICVFVYASRHQGAAELFNISANELEFPQFLTPRLMAVHVVVHLLIIWICLHSS